MEQTLGTPPVLLHSNDFESCRMLSVLEARALVAPDKAHSDLAAAEELSTSRLKRVVSPNGLSLISGKNQYEGFWNILLTLDKVYWESALILSDPRILERTFALVEYCEQTLFPHLEHRNGASHRRHSKRDLASLTVSSRITHLLQWISTTEPQKARHSHEAKMEYRGIQAQSLRDVHLGLENVIQEAELLPDVPKDIVQGNIVGAIQYATNLHPHIQDLALQEA